MSEHLMLTPLDGAHRVRLDEAAWAGLVGDELGSCLPPWAAPLPDDVPPDVVDPHPALLQALEIPQRALVTVEVASSTGSTGLRAVQWTDGAFVLGIVRAVVLDDAATPGHGARLAPGIELTAGPIDGLLGEIMRLVPPGADLASIESVSIPEEFSIALARAVRTGDMAVVDAILKDLGVGALPPVIGDLIAGIDSHLLVSMTSRSDPATSVGSWVKGRGGWVQVRRTDTGHLRHTSLDRGSLRALLLSSLTGRLGVELDRPAPGGAA